MTNKKQDQTTASEETVSGVAMSMVDTATLETVVKKLGVKVEEGAPLDEKVRALSAYFTARSGEMLQCDHCAGVSPYKYKVCPFCGDRFESAADEAPAVSEPDSSRSLVRAAKRAEGGATLAVAASNTPEKKLTEEDLNTTVGKINELKADWLSNTWELGRWIKVVHDKVLWQLRSGDAGEVLYKSFEDWRRTELGISKPLTYGFMSTAAAFSKEQAERYGWTKLNIILQVPEKERPKLVKAVEAGATQKQLVKAAKELNVAAGKGGRGRKPKKVATAPKPADVTVPEGSVSAIFHVAKKMKAWAYRSEKDARGELVAAKQIDDLPWGWVELENGVRLVVGLRRAPTGQLQFVLEARRDTAK